MRERLRIWAQFLVYICILPFSHNECIPHLGLLYLKMQGESADDLNMADMFFDINPLYLEIWQQQTLNCLEPIYPKPRIGFSTQ